MNPQEQKPVSGNPIKETPRFDLRAIYRIMIRSYLRHQMQHLQPFNEEAKHG